MTEVILWIHVGAGLVAFVLSGILSIVVLRITQVEALPRTFWRWERITQWITVVLAAAGVTLYLLGKRPQDALHLLYGALALLAILLLGAFGPNRDPKEVLGGWQVNPKWILFALNVFLWAMLGRGLSTGFFGF
ncbi:MAG: hypothetical protein OWU33_05970 [Firmicutes bacterium]|nr:hypothetical protein [Bacillota bacterium]